MRLKTSTFDVKDEEGNIIIDGYLDAIDERGPCTLEVSQLEDTLTLNDVLFGDVWVCSGELML